MTGLTLDELAVAGVAALTDDGLNGGGGKSIRVCGDRTLDSLACELGVRVEGNR